MTFPNVPLTNQWTDTESVNAVLMNARIDARLNALAARMSDTGWQALVLLGTFTGSINVRRIGNQVYVRCAVNSTGNWPQTNTIISNLPDLTWTPGAGIVRVYFAGSAGATAGGITLSVSSASVSIASWAQGTAANCNGYMIWLVD